jgi:hypothetical protein
MVGGFDFLQARSTIKSEKAPGKLGYSPQCELLSGMTLIARWLQNGHHKAQ